MKIFHRAAKGRDGSLEFMQQRIDQVAADLESPDVLEAGDSALLALVRKIGTSLQKRLQTLE
jgi:hypothetical protein